MLNLNDLKPKEFDLELSERPGKPFTLKKFSLASQIWVSNRFQNDNIEEIFKNQRIGDISEIAYYLIKDKHGLSLEQFQELVVTQKDKVALIQAMLETIGISQPLIAEITKAQESGNAPAVPTGQ